MKGRMVIAWHPDSPGSKVTFWRPWWQRKNNPHASLSEAIRAGRKVIDATERPNQGVNPYIPDRCPPSTGAESRDDR